MWIEEWIVRKMPSVETKRFTCRAPEITEPKVDTPRLSQMEDEGVQS